MVLSRALVLIGFGLIASGCIKSTSLIKVKPDGSGTIEHTMLANTAAKGLMGMGAPQGAQSKESTGILNEAEFKRAGERMGVRPISLTPLKEGNFEGAKALYAFDDISKVRVDQDPQMSGAMSGKLPVGTSSRSPIRFALTRQGDRSVLTISVDEQATASATARAQEAPSLDKVDPSMMQMIKTMFEGFRVLIDLEVEGTIVKTNADYVDGSRVTLLEVEMARVFEDEEKLRTLQSRVKPGVTLSELRPYLKDIKGVKVNHPVVTIEYR
jgi:hypothetical protein